MLFPPQFGDTVYYIRGKLSLDYTEDGTYEHNGKRYIKYHIEYPTHEFEPLVVVCPDGDNVLTKEGMTELYDGMVTLSMRYSQEDKDLYCHVRVVDTFYIEDWNTYYHNIMTGEGTESDPIWWT